MAKIGHIGLHAPGVTPPDAPIITGTSDGGDGSSVIVSVTGSDTIQLFYRIRYANDWITGLTRLGSGNITQTGLLSGTWYEFYCVIDDDIFTSGPSNIATQKVSGIALDSVALENSPAFILSEYIINALILMTNPNVSGLWPLYTSYMPDGDDVESNCGALYNTTGILDGRLMAGEVIKHQGLQLRIRSLTEDEGYDKAEEVGLGLDEVQNDTIVIDSNSYEIQNVRKTTPIIPLGLEKGTNRRYLFTINFLVTLKKVAA